MAINFPNGFNVTSQEPIDQRLVLTKEQMRSVVEARMPDVYVAICKDDGKLYTFNKANVFDEDTGKFRLHSADVTVDELAGKLPAALRATLALQSEKSGLSVDDNNNIKVNLDSDFLTVDDSNHITFSDFIIESGE